MNFRLILTLFLTVSSLVVFNSCGDDCEEKTFFMDSDGDGLGNPDETQSACEQPDGFVTNSDDLDDSDPSMNPIVLWQGDPLLFTKTDGSDWTLEGNQDRITDLVWLTRQNSNGLFNIAAEAGQVGMSSVTESPAGTEWALGTIADGVENLNFDRFVGTLEGKVGDNILSGPMVLHLIAENIYIDIEFTSWSSGNAGGQGGFSYSRSTSN